MSNEAMIAILILFTIGCLVVATWIFDGGPDHGLHRHDDDIDLFNDF